MTNKLSSIFGAVVGLAIAIILTAYGMRNVWIFLFFPTIGAIIGRMYGKKIHSVNNELSEAERLEEERKQQRKNAENIKKISLNVAADCERNANEYKELISPAYKCDEALNGILLELTNATELMGKVDAMATDTKTKGGARE